MNTPPVSGVSLADEVAARILQKRQEQEKAQARATAQLVNISAEAPGISPEKGNPGAIFNIYA